MSTTGTGTKKHLTTQNRLAAVSLRKLGPGRWHDGLGLYLQVKGSRSRVWIFKYTRHGRAHSLGLGPLHTVSLADARQRAREARRLLLDGTDPLDVRRQERAPGMTFRQAAESYIASHEAGWRSPKHRHQWGASLSTYVYPIIGDEPVAAINTASVLKVLQAIWTSRPETASRVRSRMELVLGWAKTAGHRAGDNPAVWKAHLENLLPSRSKVARIEHHAAMRHDEIAGFISDLRAVEGPAARALELLILTASRTAEVTGATWSEIDLEARQWLVPGARMKAGRDHRVPLSEPAVALLRGCVVDDRASAQGLVFGKLGAVALARVLGRLRGRGPTVHGFRASFRSWCADRGVPRELAEAALAHAVGSAVEAAYNRSDLLERRRRLMSDWASYCDGASGGKVVKLARGVR